MTTIEPLRSRSAEPDLTDEYANLLFPNTYLYTNGRETLRGLVYATGRNWCRAQDPANLLYVCTRPAGHPDYWRHVSANGDQILSAWPGSGTPPTGELVDPEDGSPADPLTVSEIDDITNGFCYKLRDRENILYVIGGASDDPRGDGEVEVLDLKNRMSRLVPISHIVPSDHVLTLDELSWVGQYINQLRKSVRDEAVIQYLGGRWCMEGLNDSLKDLGLQKYTPKLRGTYQITIPFLTKKTETVVSQIKELFDPLFAAVKEIDAPDNSHGLEISSEDIQFVVSGLQRK